MERKENKRTLIETGVETGVGMITTKLGIRIATGAGVGAAAGSTFPIVGTIVGAVVGTLIAGVVNDFIFEDEDQQLEKDKAENQRIAILEEQYVNKIHQINNYLITHQYIELRELNEYEVEKLCEEASDPNHSYFKSVALMLSYPNYLDKDEQKYKKAQEQNPTIIRIKPIANAIPIRVEIEKSFDS